MRSIIILLCLLPVAAFGQIKNNIESAEYDPLNNRYFVSNGNSILVTEDGGFNWEYFGDGGASHGMEVLNNTLYVISGTQLKGYDLASAEEVMTLSIPGVQFLNGMGNDGDHLLYVTDFNGSKIYEVDVTDNANPLYTEIISNTASTPNGCTVDLANNRAVFVNWYSNSDIKAFDLDDYTMTTVLNNSGLTNCDGIDIDNDGNFYVSSWNPQQITKFNNDFSVSEVITAPGLSNPADISYALETDTLAIANSGNDVVTFIYLGIVDDVEEVKHMDWSINLYPNPVTAASSVVLDLKISAAVQLDVVALDGRMVSQLINTTLNPGTHRVLFAGLDLSSGQYLLQGIIAGEPVSHPFLVR